MFLVKYRKKKNNRSGFLLFEVVFLVFLLLFQTPCSAEVFSCQMCRSDTDDDHMFKMFLKSKYTDIDYGERERQWWRLALLEKKIVSKIFPNPFSKPRWIDMPEPSRNERFASEIFEKFCYPEQKKTRFLSYSEMDFQTVGSSLRLNLAKYYKLKSGLPDKKSKSKESTDNLGKIDFLDGFYLDKRTIFNENKNENEKQNVDEFYNLKQKKLVFVYLLEDKSDHLNLNLCEDSVGDGEDIKAPVTFYVPTIALLDNMKEDNDSLNNSTVLEDISEYIARANKHIFCPGNFVIENKRNLKTSKYDFFPIMDAFHERKNEKRDERGNQDLKVTSSVHLRVFSGEMSVAVPRNPESVPKDKDKSESKVNQNKIEKRNVLFVLYKYASGSSNGFCIYDKITKKKLFFVYFISSANQETSKYNKNADMISDQDNNPPDCDLDTISVTSVSSVSSTSSTNDQDKFKPRAITKASAIVNLKDFFSNGKICIDQDIAWLSCCSPNPQSKFYSGEWQSAVPNLLLSKTDEMVVEGDNHLSEDDNKCFKSQELSHEINKHKQNMVEEDRDSRLVVDRSTNTTEIQLAHISTNTDNGTDIIPVVDNEQELSDLKNEVTALLKRISSHESDKKAHETEAEQVSFQTKSIIDLLQCFNILNDSFEKVNLERITMQKTYDKLVSEYNNIKEQNEHLSNVNFNQSRTVSELNQKLEEEIDIIEGLNKDLSTVNAISTSDCEHLNETRDQLKELNKTVDVLKVDLIKVHDQLLKKTEEIKVSEKIINEQLAAKKSFEQKFNKVISDSESLKILLQDKTQSLVKTQQVLNDLQGRYNTNIEEFTKLSSDCIASVKDLENSTKTIAELNKNIASLEVENKSLQDELTQVRKESDKLNTTLKDDNLNSEQLDTKAIITQKDNSKLEEDYSNARSKTSDMFYERLSNTPGYYESYRRERFFKVSPGSGIYMILK